MLIADRMDPGSFWLLIGAAGATTLLMFRIHAARRRQSSAKSPVLDSARAAPAHRPQGVERWEAELYDFAREIEARLDNKIAALQQLVITADDRIAKLESLGLDEPPQPAVESSPPSTLAGPHFADTTARHAAVYAMSDAGNNAATIANRLGTPLGEVELILSLRRP